MAVTLKDQKYPVDFPDFMVSILIIMAVTLKVTLLPFCSSRAGCFNPYYNGSDSKSAIYFAQAFVELEFQSLL